MGMYLEEPGVASVRGDRRQDPRLPARWRATDLWLDATYVKMREAGRVVAVTIAVAVNDQVLGMAVGASELLDRVPALPGPRRQAGGLTTKGSRLTRVLGATALPRPLHAQSAMPASKAVVSAFVAFAQEDADSAQWRQVQLRTKVPKLAALMDEARPSRLYDLPSRASSALDEPHASMARSSGAPTPSSPTKEPSHG